MEFQVQNRFNLPEPKVFMEFSVELVPTGVRLQAKSPELAEFFKRLPERTPTERLHKVWTGLKPRSLVFAADASIPIRRDWSWWAGDTTPNFIWLTDPALATGLDVVLTDPLPLNSLSDWFLSSQTGIINFYQNYLRTAKLSATFTQTP